MWVRQHFSLSSCSLVGCAGSTSCGIKVFPLPDHLRSRQTAFGQGVLSQWRFFTMRYNGAKVDDQVSEAVMNFFAVYFLIVRRGRHSAQPDRIGLSLHPSRLRALRYQMSARVWARRSVRQAVSRKSTTLPKWISVGGHARSAGLNCLRYLVLFMPRFWRD